MKRGLKRKEPKGTLYFFGIPLTGKSFFWALYIVSIFVSLGIVLHKLEKSFISLAFIYLWVCAYIYYRQKTDDLQNIYRKISWIYDKNSYTNRGLNLYEYIEIEQSNLKIPQQHCIDFSNEFEKESLSQILNEHKDQVVKNYFCNRLKEGTNIYNLSSLEYYFLSLYCFVDEKPSYYDNKAYEKREKISDYTFKCQLTEYGRVYYKLKLITQSYIENNKQVQNLFNYIDKEKRNRLAEALDKNEVIFYR